MGGNAINNTAAGEDASGCRQILKSPTTSTTVSASGTAQTLSYLDNLFDVLFACACVCVCVCPCVPGLHMFECMLVCVGVCASEGFPFLCHSFLQSCSLKTELIIEKI